MARVEKTIDVDVPVSVAYNQWTQFESFPEFMEGVHEVRQLDDSHLHWRAKVGGKEEEWDAVIREQVPDQKIIWRNTSGAENAGMVTFDQLGGSKTRVHLEMSYDPEGFVENVGDALGMVSRRVDGDLKRFKDFIESRGSQTGEWRGTIRNPDVDGGHTRGDTSASSSDKGSGQHSDLEGSGRMAADRDTRYGMSSSGMGTGGVEERNMGRGITGDYGLSDEDARAATGGTASTRFDPSRDLSDRASYGPESDPLGTVAEPGYGEGMARPLGGESTPMPQRDSGMAPGTRRPEITRGEERFEGTPDMDRGRSDNELRDMH